jgi:Na+/melibiose symporter-like transporter
MLAGMPLMMLAAYQLFVLSGPVSNTYLLTWSVLLWFGWTMINIPCYAWGPFVLITAVIWRYPITKRRLAQLRHAFDRRDNRRMAAVSCGE